MGNETEEIADAQAWSVDGIRPDGPSLTVCILSQNSANRLPGLLSQVSPLANEVLLVDGGSSDDTVNLVLQYPNVRMIVRPFDGNFAKQRNHGMDNARSDWVLFLDTDELLGPNLVKLLPELLECPHDCVRLPRYWLSPEDERLYVETPKLYPNPQTRLIRNKPELRFDERQPVHERIPRSSRGPLLKVRGCHILHYCFVWSTLEGRQRKVKFYESVDQDSERINYVYLYEESVHKLRRCRETWHDGVAEVRSPLDLLLERIRIRIINRWIYPLAKRFSG